jgi:bacillithiol biosynthesis deacetylase BshB1
MELHSPTDPGLALLAFGAHPDDVELSAGGVLAKLASRGAATGIVDLTRGELGTRGTATTRAAEAAEASRILGLSCREQLGLSDGFFETDEAALRQVIEVLRRLRPQVVLANARSDRHPDHARASELVTRACFLSGLRRIETSDRLTGQPQLPWRPPQLYYYIQDRWRDPDFVVDVTGFAETKMAAVLAYKTQFHRPDAGPDAGPDAADEPATPISTPDFLDQIRSRLSQMGRLVGCEAGEGFESERPLGVVDFRDLK